MRRLAHEGGAAQLLHRSGCMQARPPVAVISRDDSTQDRYVFALRRQRIPALGVNTYGSVVELDRHLMLGAIIVDVSADEDWEGCRLLRRPIPHAFPLVILTDCVAPDGEFRRRARRIGCAGFVDKTCSPAVVADLLQRLARGEAWVEYIGERDWL